MERTIVHQKHLPDKVAASHLRMLRAISWEYHSRTGHDPEDLYSEACLKYLLCRDNWDPKRGVVTTHLYRAIFNHLHDYLSKTWGYGKTIKMHDGSRIPVEYIPLEKVEQMIIMEHEMGFKYFPYNN